MPRLQRLPADYFSLEDMNDLMDGIAARRPVAGSAEPFVKPDYRAKRHPRPAERQRHERRTDKRGMWQEVV